MKGDLDENQFCAQSSVSSTATVEVRGGASGLTAAWMLKMAGRNVTNASAQIIGSEQLPAFKVANRLISSTSEPVSWRARSRLYRSRLFAHKY